MMNTTNAQKLEGVLKDNDCTFSRTEELGTAMQQ
jgi:hypothetical protein